VNGKFFSFLIATLDGFLGMMGKLEASWEFDRNTFAVKRQ